MATWDGAMRALRRTTAFDPYTLEHRDPAWIAALLPLFRGLARRYFRVDASGHEHIRPRATLYVANHNGGIMGPDLPCTLSMLWERLGVHYPLYAMAHDFAMRRITPLGRLLQGMGAMRADPANARRVLRGGGSVLVYPGGDLDAYRPFWQRDRVVFGQRIGFARAAIEAGVPIVPIVAQGAHRSALIFHEGRWLAQALGLTRWSRIQRFPLALSLPWGIGIGPWVPYMPMPFRIRLRALPPIDTHQRDPQHVRDEVVAAMQAALETMGAPP